LKKELPGRPGQVNFSSGQEISHSYLPDEQGISKLSTT